MGSWLHLELPPPGKNTVTDMCLWFQGQHPRNIKSTLYRVTWKIASSVWVSELEKGSVVGPADGHFHTGWELFQVWFAFSASWHTQPALLTKGLDSARSINIGSHIKLHWIKRPTSCNKAGEQCARDHGVYSPVIYPSPTGCWLTERGCLPFWREHSVQMA